MRPLQQNDIFHAISHPARRAILLSLRAGDQPASQLAQPFGVTFAAISQHLKILKDAELVTEKRDGRQRIYHLQPRPLQEVWTWAENFEAFWTAHLDALEEHLDKKYPRPKKR